MSHWREHRADDAMLTPAQRFRQATDELERLVWLILRRPGVPESLVRILQITAAAEILPNIYVEIADVAFTDDQERYIRLWYEGLSPDGETVEIPLLSFHTDSYPDANARNERLGMNMNAQWWEVVHQRLLDVVAYLEEQGATLGLPSPAETQMSALPGEGELPSGLTVAQIKAQLARTSANLSALLTGQHQTPSARQTPPAAGPGAAMPGRATGAPGPRRPTGAPPAAQPMPAPHSAPLQPQEAHQLDEMRRQLQLLFKEYEGLREEAYHQCDALERKLTERYFLLHPLMKLAATRISEQDTRAAVTKWVEQGCPPPVEDELPPGLTPLLGISDDAERARQINEVIAEARATVLELERARLRVEERARVLQQLCELSGGHVPKAERDAQGAPRTVCARCGAPLYRQAPERREGWLN